MACCKYGGKYATVSVTSIRPVAFGKDNAPIGEAPIGEANGTKPLTVAVGFTILQGDAIVALCIDNAGVSREGADTTSIQHSGKGLEE